MPKPSLFTTEKQVEKSIIDWLRAKGYWCQKVHSGAMQKSYTNKAGFTNVYWVKLADQGTCDILACVDGIFVGIEVKKNEAEIRKWHRQTEDRDRAQRAQHLAIMKAGGHVIIACSPEEVDKDIEEIKNMVKHGPKSS